MINLLPQTDKDIIKREYFMRLTVLALVFLLITVVIALIFLVPSYITSSLDKKAVKVELETLKEKRDPNLDTISSAIISANNNLVVFPDPTTKESFLDETLKPILDNRKIGVNISEILYFGDDPKQTLTIGGVSVSREKLLAFVASLEATGKYEKIDVPISNLLKDQNVEFKLEIIRKKQ